VSGQRARIDGRITINEQSYLRVSEVVETAENATVRKKASYYFVENKTERWGYDLDPSHEPAEHGHRGAEHERVEASCLTLARAIEAAWQMTSEVARDGLAK